MDLLLASKFTYFEVNITDMVKTKFMEEEVEAVTTQEGSESPFVWTGTGTHNFIDIHRDHLSQFEMATYLQGYNEIKVIEVSVVTFFQESLASSVNLQYGECMSAYQITNIEGLQ